MSPYQMLFIWTLFRFSMWSADLVFLTLRFLWALESRLCSLFVSSLAMKNSASVENRKETNCFDVRSRSAEDMWSNRYIDVISLRFRSCFWCALFSCFWRCKWIVRVIDDASLKCIDEAFLVYRLSPI